MQQPKGCRRVASLLCARSEPAVGKVQVYHGDVMEEAVGSKLQPWQKISLSIWEGGLETDKSERKVVVQKATATDGTWRRYVDSGDPVCGSAEVELEVFYVGEGVIKATLQMSCISSLQL